MYADRAARRDILRLSALAIPLAILIFPSGCSVPYLHIYRAAISANQQALQQLQLGMTSAQVLSLMGEGEIVRYKKISLVDPWRTAGFSLVDGTKVRIFYYVTQPPRKYSRPSDEALTPLVLENDRLVGWGGRFFGRIPTAIRFQRHERSDSKRESEQ